MQLIRLAARRMARDDGFTTVALMGALVVTALLTVAAFAAVDNDQLMGRRDQDSKTAYAAAEAGINDYLYHLNQDNAYWAKCTNVAAPNAVNQPWNGTGTDPRTWRNVPGSNAQYTIELLPANGFSQCDRTQAQASMIDSASGTFRIRATGRSAAGVSRLRKRSIVATFRRKGFLDFLYFTDYETADPTWYQLDTSGRPTNPDLIAWASANCNRYARQARLDQSYSGQILWFDNKWYPWTDKCTEIRFANNDQILGPTHTNDQFLVCGSPIFGRNAQDRVEASDPTGWRPDTTSGCGNTGPTFNGTWIPNAPILTMPPTDSALKAVTDTNYRFTGTTRIVLSGTTMTVTNAARGLNNTVMNYPPNGVIYVANGACGQTYNPLDPYNSPAGCADVYVHGSYGTDLTIASEKDIIVDGDTTRAGDNMLGLIANNFVRVYHPVVRDSSDPTKCSNGGGTLSNVSIDAAILSLQHSFTVDNYYCGAALSNLSLNGALGQKFRGPVGRGNGNDNINGYTKRYTYDDRLRFRSPPHFIDPVQSAWRIVRYTEQVPPRG